MLGKGMTKWKKFSVLHFILKNQIKVMFLLMELYMCMGGVDIKNVIVSAIIYQEEARCGNAEILNFIFIQKCVTQNFSHFVINLPNIFLTYKNLYRVQ